MTTAIIAPIGNKRVKSRKEAFLKLISDNKNKRWYVCSHDNPDPDSIASCIGMIHILTFLGVEDCRVVYCGEIGSPQNRAMVNVLQIHMHRWETEEPPSDAMFIFLDCAFGQKNMSIKETPSVIVDHHKITTGQNRDICYIQDEVGACSTLIFDLALSINSSEHIDGISQCFDPDENHIEELATALAIGIKTDTLDFLTETTTPEDFHAFRVLSQHLSDEKFNKIINYEIPPYVFDFEQIAWQNKRPEFQPHFITGLGYIDEAKSDCIPAIADKFKQLQGVQTVVVFGIVDNTLRASVRTSSASIDCQNLCDEIFGKGSGGSKHGIGGARVHLNVFCPAEMNAADKNSLWLLIKNQIESRFERTTTK